MGYHEDVEAEALDSCLNEVSYDAIRCHMRGGMTSCCVTAEVD